MGDHDTPTLVQERNAALLSLDLQAINSYMRKYGSPELPDNEIGWAAIHKARSAIVGFAEEDRKLSRDWLDARGYKHWGDDP